MKTFLFIIAFSFLSLDMYSQLELWGMTYSGGKDNGGVIFKLDESGNNQEVEYEFPKLDFVDPYNNKMIQASNGMLYGLTTHGGKYQGGVLFQYDPSTLQYTVKFSFKQETGSEPFFLMQAKDGMLYGLTSKGGIPDQGVLFQYNLQTNTYSPKFEFHYEAGLFPIGFMQASNGMLYGLTREGGDGDGGVLFEFNPFQSTYTRKINLTLDSSGLSPASSFLQTSNGMMHALFMDGGSASAAMFEYDPVHETLVKKLDLPDLNPASSNGVAINGTSLLLAKDGMIYGTASMGGVHDKGIFFQYNPLIPSFIKKTDFNSANGSYPIGCLTEGKDGMIYGLTLQGGTFEYLGVVFQYNPASSVLTKKLDLNGSNGGMNGSASGGLTLATDGMLYGLGNPTQTHAGGGIIFRYNTSANTYTELLNTHSYSLNGKAPRGSLLKAKDGMLYGLNSSGGLTDSGTLFQYNPLTHVYTKKFDFGGSNGQSPNGTLTQAQDGMLYGTTTYGGIAFGTLFSYAPLTSSFTKKLDFGKNNQCYFPTGSLMQAADGMLYGMTPSGGGKSRGTLFKYEPAFNDFTEIDYFKDTGCVGNQPLGALIQAKDGMMYGLTSASGSNSTGNGSMFQFNPVTLDFTCKHNFEDPAIDITPTGSLVQASDGMLYGTATESGSDKNMGFLFQYDLTTHTLTKRFIFDGKNGSHPSGSLVQGSNGMLYGMTFDGGAYDLGVIFQFDPKTGTYTKKLDFDGKNGAYPTGDLIEINPAVGIEENFFSNNIHIFPNPGNGIFYVQLDASIQAAVGEITRLEVINVLGERVLEIPSTEIQLNRSGAGLLSQRIDLSHVSSGIYFVNIKTQTGGGTKKLIKH